MTAVIHFRPLLGILADEPLAYLLSIDDYKILVDCGWTDSLDPSILEPLRPYVADIDAVLISHADMSHMGGLPYAITKLGMKKAKIYGTVPVFNMGKLFLYDVYQSKKMDEEFELLSIEDIDVVFDERFIQLKYSQRCTLSGKAQGIELTPYASGHTLGGTCWKIAKDTEEIVYAVDYNNKTDRHLNGTVLGQPSGPSAPSLLITDAYVSPKTPIVSRQDRDARLSNFCKEVLRSNGNVLIPTDTAARVLEILCVLDSQWEFHKLPYSLVLLNKVGYNTTKIAQTQLEWMSDNVRKTFENSRENPFHFKHVQLVYDLESLKSLKSPMVVMCTSGALEFGFARRLFVEWAANENNALVFPERILSRSLAAEVLTAMETKRLPARWNLQLKRRVPLEGDELAEFERKRREEKQKQMEKEAEERRKRELEDQDDDEEDLDTGPRQSHFSGGVIDLVLPAYADVQTAPPPYPMFPYKERIVQWDDYGMTFQGEPLVNAAAAASAALANGAPTSALESNIVQDDEMAAVEDADEEPQATKCITEQVTVDVRCKVLHVDFEARSDFRSVKNITTTVNPSRLILVHSSAENKAQLSAQLPKLAEKTFIPTSPNDDLNMTSDSRIFPLKLKDQLLDTLNFVQEGDYELAYVQGEIQPPAQLNGLPLLAEPSDNASIGHPAVFIGDVKMSELRSFLSRNGFYTELQAGVLYCNRVITIRKDDNPAEFRSALTVEGILCDDYFRVRELLYQQFKIL